MFRKIIKSRALVIVLLYAFVFLIVTEAMPFKQIAAQVEESTPVFRVKTYGKKVSPAQKKNFEQIIAEGIRLLQDEMDYEGAIIQFKEAEALAVTQPQKSDVYFYLSLAYYATMAERGEEDFKETVRRLIEVDYYRELDMRLCPPNYIDIFQGIKAEYGVLRVQSRPPEADVYIEKEEEPSGKTPLTIGIRAGSIDIKVKKGSKEKEDTLEVTAGQRTTSPIYVLKGKSGLLFVLGGIALAGGVGVVLFLGKKKKDGGVTPPGPTTGSISVNSTPAGAKIYLDGTDTGKTTNTTLTNQSPGSHIVKLVKEGYKNVEQSISVTAGQTASLNISLSQHTITVTSPTSSTIWAKGTEVEIKWTYDEATKSLGNINSNAWINYRLRQGNSLSPSINNRLVRNNPSSKGTDNSRGKFDDTRTSRNSEELLKESIQDRKSLQQKSSLMNVSKKEHINSVKQRNLGSIDTLRSLNLPISPKTSFGFPNPSIQGSRSGDDIRILILTNVKIELYFGGGVVETIASSTANDGSHMWEIPASLSDGANYKVRISCVADTNVYGESDAFEIKESPNFFDDFEDGNADGWDLGSGWQVEKDGSNFVLSGSYPDWSMTTRGKNTWKNYSLKARIKLIEGDGQVNYCKNSPLRYIVGFRLHTIWLTKRTRLGNYEDLASADIDINYNEWHTVEVVGNGGHLKVYFDDVLLLEYIDPDPYLSGQIGFENSAYGHVHIDDVLVEEIK